MTDDPAALLAHLRSTPPIGTWVPVDEHMRRPGPEGYVTRTDAEAEARRLGFPYVAKVVRTPGGWSIGDLWCVDD